MEKLNFEDWYNEYEEDLRIYAAESGMDRELDFEESYERLLDNSYEEYLKQIELKSLDD